MTLLIVILIGFYVYALFRRKLGAMIFSLPLVMTAFGLLLSGRLTEAMETEASAETLRLLAEITLVLVLFSDASRIKLSVERRYWKIPARLLFIAMPLAILLGAGVTYALLPAGGLLIALFVSAVLAPTDAALAQPVVNNEDLPVRVTSSLNVESGLNDGLAVPFVFGSATLLAGLAIEAPVQTIVLMLTLAPIVGVAVGYITARLLDWAAGKHYLGATSASVVYIITPFLAYLISEEVGGNGFIAAFVAGATFGNVVKQPVESITEFMESEGQILTMVFFFVFGALILPTAFEFLTVTHVVLALLFLTVVRMLPVFLSLLGSETTTREKLFMGWFGPRGLASVLYTLVVAEGYDFPNKEIALSVISLTVFLSIILHGVTATPLSKRLVRAEAKA